MSWAPADLVTDTDLLAYEGRILSTFGKVEWADKRQKVLEDWLFPALRSQGLDPSRFRTRYAPASVLAFDGSSTYSDLTSAATSTTTDDLALATVFASASHALYVGADQAFRGLSWRVLDTPNATAGTLTVSVWGDAWTRLAVGDDTQATSGVPFSRGGAITWGVPSRWVSRPVNGTDGYWAKLTLSAVPTGAKAGQLGVIRRSLLCGPVVFRTLCLIFREAPVAQEGPWADKASWYEVEAERALTRVLPLVGGEFDSETEDDQIDATEAAQTTSEAAGTVWSFERA